MTFVAGIVAAALAAFTTVVFVRTLLPRFPLRRRNYRGIPVTTALGVAPFGGVLVGIASLNVISLLWPGHFATGLWIVPLAALGGFAVLGLLDDVVSTLAHGPERGFAGHAGSLIRGKVTTGGIKLVAGGALAISIALPITRGRGFMIFVAATLVIALSANLMNSFDVRPGRASKAFLAGAIPLAILGGSLRPLMLVAVGAIVALLPFDLRERAMAGDTGANGFGALLGACAVLLASTTTLLVVTAVLIIIQVAAETVTLSTIIDGLPFLRAVDRAGSAPRHASSTNRSKIDAA